MVLVRAINYSSTEYIPVSIGTQYKTTIENNCANKGWSVIWLSGVDVI